MKLKYNNNIHSVQTKLENDLLTSTIDNNSFSYKFEKLDENSGYIYLDGKKHRAYWTFDNKNCLIWLDGHSFRFDFLDESSHSSDNIEQNANRQEVTAPMPGSIVKIMVEVGQQVAESQPLLIVEAMKMETTLYSQISGIVKEINCKEKEQVDSDKILIVIEKEG